jgi:hypothetical protein
MIKLTLEDDEFKKDIEGRFIFAVTGRDDDPAAKEEEAAATIAFVGETTPRELAETVGHAIGSQIRQICDDPLSMLEIVKICQESVLKGLIGDGSRIKPIMYDIKERDPE